MSHVLQHLCKPERIGPRCGCVFLILSCTSSSDHDWSDVTVEWKAVSYRMLVGYNATDAMAKQLIVLLWMATLREV